MKRQPCHVQLSASLAIAHAEAEGAALCITIKRLGTKTLPALAWFVAARQGRGIVTPSADGGAKAPCSA